MANDLSSILKTLQENLDFDRSFEFHPFKIQDYNAKVSSKFALQYPDETLAVLVLSGPQMFENVLIPWMKTNYNGLTEEEIESKARDPVDQCMIEVMTAAKKTFDDSRQIEVLYDFDLHPNRRPKILMGTAGHVSGACAYYHPLVDLPEGSWTSDKGMGLSIHPRYGGWFAFRSVLIFPGHTLPLNHCTPSPQQILTDVADVRRALELFNFHWEDCRYRDIIGAPIAGDDEGDHNKLLSLQRYSSIQREYFAAMPKDRTKVILKILNHEY